MLCVRVAFPPVFENFLKASGDKRMKASDRSLCNSILILSSALTVLITLLRLLSCVANPEWHFGIWLQLTQHCQVSGGGQTLEFLSRLVSSSLFHLMHPIFV